MNTKQIDKAIFELEYYMQVAEASELEAPGMVFALKTMRALKVVGALFDPDEKPQSTPRTPLRSVKDDE